MNRLEHATLAIRSLTGSFSIEYSPYTNKWYMTVPNLSVSDGYVTGHPCEHRDTPEEAVIAFFDRLREECTGTVPYVLLGDNRVTITKEGVRRAYLWSGVGFHEVQEEQIERGDK